LGDRLLTLGEEPLLGLELAPKGDTLLTTGEILLLRESDGLLLLLMLLKIFLLGDLLIGGDGFLRGDLDNLLTGREYLALGPRSNLLGE
jgi:hypothetical protein